MTDEEEINNMNKVQKIREEVERIQLYTQSEVLKQVLDYIDEVQKEPVSEDLEEAAYQYANCFKNQFEMASMAFIKGAKWKELQLEKNRLKHCNSITNEQAALEQGFIGQHLDKHQRIPTFLDAIEYGMRLKEKEMQSTIELAEDHAMLAGMEKMKEEMMANAIDVEVKVDAGGYPYIDRTIELYDYDKDEPLAAEGDKVKVIIIKE